MKIFFLLSYIIVVTNRDVDKRRKYEPMDDASAHETGKEKN